MRKLLLVCIASAIASAAMGDAATEHEVLGL